MKLGMQHQISSDYQKTSKLENSIQSALIKQGDITVIRKQPVARTKYHNKKTEIDGILFDSQKEANRYSELKLLEKTEEIWLLRTQPKFELQPSFVDSSGHKQRAITYSADFYYQDKKTKRFIVEDCKGMKTEVYKLKKKLFLKLFPQYIFVEV